MLALAILFALAALITAPPPDRSGENQIGQAVQWLICLQFAGAAIIFAIYSFPL